MDALSANPAVGPPVATPPPAPLATAVPSPRPGAAPAVPLTPAVDGPALPLTVQRDLLRPPAPPLMTGEEMTALLRAVVGGG